VGDRGAQPRRLSRFRELKFTYVGFFSPCNPKDKTTVSPAMLITTSRVALRACANTARCRGSEPMRTWPHERLLRRPKN
jgi:hypothetical protein